MARFLGLLAFSACAPAAARPCRHPPDCATAFRCLPLPPCLAQASTVLLLLGTNIGAVVQVGQSASSAVEAQWPGQASWWTANSGTWPMVIFSECGACAGPGLCLLAGDAKGLHVPICRGSWTRSY